MASTIEIPSFDFSAFYYSQILEALLDFKRANVPELTDESPQEPLIQLLRAFACVGHLNNTTVDLVANECTLPTSRLVETVRNMLRLIDYELPSAVPAQTDLVYVLSQVLSAQTEVVPQYALASTTREGDTDPVYFQALEALTVDPTNVLSKAIAVESTVVTDVTAEANSDPGVSTFTPWATPEPGSGTQEGDFVAFCHEDAMYGQIDVDVTTGGSGLTGIWEYFDGDWEKGNPNSVTDNGSYLTFEVDAAIDLLGQAQDLRGLIVRVTLNATGASEDCYAYYSGGKNKIDTAGLLGQSVPSTDIADYTVGGQWNPFGNVTDGTSNMAQDGAVEYTFPQTLLQNWRKATYDGTEGFWSRFRLTATSAPSSPVVGQVKIDQGDQYVARLVTQGRLQVDDPLGTSDGTAGQRFEGTKENYVDSTATVTVDEVTWTEVSNLLSSRPTDRHYTIELEENDRPVFVFGDGVTGAIPPPGVGNIAATYRYGAHENGNVGASTVTNDKDGLTYVDRIWNPRPATGWAEAAGASETSLEAAKLAGPASLRTGNVALGPDDVQNLAARAFEIDSTQMKVSRSIALEEYFGPKTTGLIVVPAGGEYASSDSLDALSVFFNGDQFSVPVKPKRVVANQEVTARNYVKRVVDVTVSVETTGNLTKAQVENALTQLLQPEALKDDGVTYVWSFGGRVPVSRLEHEIFNIDETITDVDVTVPSSDLTLASNELPYVGTLSVSIV